MSRRNWALPPPHKKPDGETCGYGSYFPTKEDWHGHGGRDKCSKCKADVSKPGIPENRGGGGILIDAPWPSDSNYTQLYLWLELDYNGYVDYDSILLKILRCDNDGVDDPKQMRLVSGSAYQWDWANKNCRKLNEELTLITGRDFYVEIIDAPDIFTDPSNTWITDPEN
jgi:hypothetical protein|tara:strand:- start:574 stop:1080 length:507 start_codon:yes stop_codon:yes gene_type:complete